MSGQRRVRAVIALGGNAFERPREPLSVKAELSFAREAIEQLAPILRSDVDLLFVHGNGPQVGHLLARSEAARDRAYPLPLDVCGAASQGELGYVLAQSLRSALEQRGALRPIAAVLTQVEVDTDDRAFGKPTKRIGPVLDEVRAAEVLAEGGVVAEDAHGLRRVVASPEPRTIVEADVIAKLVEAGVVVIAGGGGGVPVVRVEGRLSGVEAVVDKDLTAALLADAIDADLLLIVTTVPCAYIGFRSEEQARIGRIEVFDAAQLLAAGAFGEGTMAPKIRAGINFVTRPGRRAVICDAESLAAAFLGEAGTVIVPDGASR